MKQVNHLCRRGTPMRAGLRAIAGTVVALGLLAGQELSADDADVPSDAGPLASAVETSGPVVFRARRDAGAPNELWVSQGAAENTRRLRSGELSEPRDFMLIGGGRAIFSGQGALNGRELWVTDGTRRNTYTVLDIAPGADDGDPQGFAPLGGGIVLFSAWSPENGRELWRTDGRARATRMVRNIAAGALSSDPLDIVALGGGRAVFSARLDDTGRELWVTDGTRRGTRLLRDFNSGWPSGLALHGGAIAPLGGGRALVLAFSNNQPDSSGFNLWVTNGRRAGTRPIAGVDLLGDFPVLRGSFVLQPGLALFNILDGVDLKTFITDGTPEGTRLFEGQGGPVLVNLLSAVHLSNDRVIFTGYQPDTGNEPWIMTTDGEPLNVSIIRDIHPMSGSEPDGYTVIGNGLAVFGAENPRRGNELWITNGTRAGTVLVRDIYRGQMSSSPYGFESLGNGLVLFAANNRLRGRELWITDGTEEGTTLVRDIWRGGADGNPAELTALGGPVPGPAIGASDGGAASE